jgi:predicted transcriptional regulator
VELFSNLGMPKNLAKTLMYISQVDECKSTDIELGADLRQPEVSIAMQELRKRGWVAKKDLKKKGKGRPTHIYSTTMDLHNIIDTLEKEKLTEIDNIKNNISELRDTVQNLS